MNETSERTQRRGGGGGGSKSQDGEGRPRRNRRNRSGRNKNGRRRSRNQNQNQNQGQSRDQDREFDQRNYNRADDTPTGPATDEEGLLEISGKGFGFLRVPERAYKPSPKDVFVTPEIVRKFGLRDGLWVKCEARQGGRGPS